MFNLNTTVTNVIQFIPSTVFISIFFLLPYRLIHSVVVLMILFDVLQLSHQDTLKCEFKNYYSYKVGYLNTCELSPLENPYNNITITGHNALNGNDVKSIFVHHTNTAYIPSNIGFMFPFLSDFYMGQTQLVEIKANNFLGMQELKSLSLYGNKLKILPADAFAALTKLRFIYLSSNQIEEIPVGIFDTNVNLELISLEHNSIKFIGVGLFNVLIKLEEVQLFNNTCVARTYTGAPAILQLKEDIKLNCTKPIEVPQPTTQSPLDLLRKELENKLIKSEMELAAAKEQIQKDLIEITNLKDELQKERLAKNDLNLELLVLKVKMQKDQVALEAAMKELYELKIQQGIDQVKIKKLQDEFQIEHEEKLKLIIARDQLMTQLTEAKELQKIMELEINKLKDIQQKERLENIQVVTERDDLKKMLAAAKNDLLLKTTEINKCTVEKDDLMKQLAEAKNEILKKTAEINKCLMEKEELKKQIVPAINEPNKLIEIYKKKNNNLNNEIIALKKQRQVERKACNELKLKLMKATDKLALLNIP
ncbi:unnamed protein product [Diamesa hyperborea]